MNKIVLTSKYFENLENFEYQNPLFPSKIKKKLKTYNLTQTKIHKSQNKIDSLNTKNKYILKKKREYSKKLENLNNLLNGTILDYINNFKPKKKQKKYDLLGNYKISKSLKKMSFKKKNEFFKKTNLANSKILKKLKRLEIIEKKKNEKFEENKILIKKIKNYSSKRKKLRNLAYCDYEKNFEKIANDFFFQKEYKKKLINTLKNSKSPYNLAKVIGTKNLGKYEKIWKKTNFSQTSNNFFLKKQNLCIKKKLPKNFKIKPHSTRSIFSKNK